MRFLFVYQDYSEQARKLLDDLAVRDVTLIIARKNANTPTADEIKLLEAHRGADAAACEINRKYRKSAAPYVTFCCEPKKFRFEDQQLREWLVPKDRVGAACGRPSAAFLAAARRTSMLVLHPDALKFADDLIKHRWEFATVGADLLARYALGESLGPLRDWKAARGIEFAATGRVAYKYRGTCGTEMRDGRTEWHLKDGDNTSRESAARVYFVRVAFSSGPRVIVFYVGPHPEDGERSISFTAPLT
jgi:hypothetical protein